MSLFLDPSRHDQEEFLVCCYFRIGTDYLTRCIHRAYLDFCRTIHGINEFPGIYKKAASTVQRQLDELRIKNDMDQPAFDDWHRRACHSLSTLYAEHGYNCFYVGQSQKWLNMSLKYIFALGEERLSGYQRLYKFCHIPLDKIIIGKLSSAPYNFDPLSSEWSRLKEYGEYIDYQNKVRNAFPGVSPLAVEFRLWQDQ
jgi:hypothetical protein